MKASEIKGQVDFGIITIREDEFEAVLKRFPKREVATGKRRYNLSHAPTWKGDRYTVASIRCIEQGNGEAMDAARDLLEELDPQWLLVVGIAGGMPASEYTLGDVVVSTRVHDFSVEAVLHDGEREYALGGGPIHRDAAMIAADLPAMKEELGDWSSASSIGVARPPVDLDAENFYGDAEWQKKARESLRRHFEGRSLRGPIVTAGAIASSDRLIKDTEMARVWRGVARQILAVEMESAGVYRAVSGRGVPALAIRGISDIIGFKRDPGWTTYACHTAAAFARGLLHARPIEPRSGGAPAAAPRPPSGSVRAVYAEPARPLGTRPRSVAEPTRDPGRRAPSPAPALSPGRDKVFISFSPQDREALDALKVALDGAQRAGLVTTWDTTQILGGEVKAEKIAEAIDSAKLAVLLVSARFLADSERDREVSALLSAGVPLLCLYLDHSPVEYATYPYVDLATGTKKTMKLLDLRGLNEPDKPLKGLSGSAKSAELVRAVKQIVEAAERRKG